MEARCDVLVVGATGKQGRATVKYLLENEDKYHVLALTRDPSSKSACQLLDQNKQHATRITLVRGDLDDQHSVRKIFQDAASSHGQPIWGVFVALAYPGLGASAEGEIQQGKVIADLALEFRVQVFVYSSAIQVGADAADAQDASHRAKPQIEAYVKDLGSKGLEWIIIRPGFFMENFDGLSGAIAVSAMRAGLNKDTAIDLIASQDIGRVAAGVLAQHDRFMHETLTISSEAATMDHIAASYQKAIGKSIPAAPTLVGKALVRFNAALQSVINEIKLTHDARVMGQSPGLQSGIELAKSICTLRTYYEWKTEEKDATADKNWNQVSLFRLMTGRS